MVDDKALTSQTQEQNADHEAQTDYPSGPKLAVITLALCLAVFLVALDNTIIATAIPRITDRFHAIEDIGWYGSAYLLTTCAFQLFYGKLYSFYSIKWVYLIAIFIFELGSVICGAAPTSTTLIVGRAIAGIGCAGIFSGTFTIIAFAVPLARRPLYNGILGAVYGVSSVAGPLMGGAFTDKVSWRWCFYINLPIGAVAWAVVLFLFTAPPPARQSKVSSKDRFMQMDPLGTLFLIAGVVCLLLVLTWGGSKYAWNNGRIIALLVLFAIFAIIFIVIQIRGADNATVPSRIIMQRSIAGAALFSVTTGGAFFLLVYFIPIWFQAIKGVSAVKSGIMNLAMVLATVVSSIVGGGMIATFGYFTPFLIASSILSAIGAGMLTTFTVHSGHAQWIGYQALYGLGVGLSMQTPIIVIQTILPPSDIPAGTALIMFLQTLGGSVFVSVGESVFSNKLIAGISQVAGHTYAAEIINKGATSLRTAVPAPLLPAILIKYNDALTHTWYISLALASVSILGALSVEWKSVKANTPVTATSDAVAEKICEEHTVQES